MGAERKGYVEPCKDAKGAAYYRARIHLADGSRPRFRVPDEHARSEKAAEAWARWLQSEEDTKGEILKAKNERRAAAVGASAAGETVEKWCERWLADRDARGIGSATTHDGGRLRKYVWPMLGPLEMRAVTSANIEAVVTKLDDLIRHEDPKERISWRTASNAWVLVTKMFDDAAHSKRRDLRVRADNPASSVRAPDRGLRKAKQYLYPSEFESLVRCTAIERPFRILYAAAVYTFARAGELQALLWSDVDLEHGIIHITKAVDRETGEVKSTKSGETRRVPIEANLRPLLERLRKGRTGDDSSAVFWLPPHEDRAILLRDHLGAAELERAELRKNDEQHKHLTFHDLRATGITWAAVRGDDPLRIKQRAGHKAFTTTEGYIREAENLRAGFGVPFPPLPPDLIDAPTEPDRPTEEPITEVAYALPSTILCGATGDRTPERDRRREESSADRRVEDPREATIAVDGASIGPAMGPSVGASADVVEAVLAEVIRSATAAGRWEVVMQLARELEARRTAKAGANVVSIGGRGRRATNG